MMPPDTTPASAHDGLLDRGDQAAKLPVQVLDVQPDDDVDAISPWQRDPATSRGFSRLVIGVSTLVVAALSTYVVPQLAPLQPWRAGEDYIIYWNLIGREFMGQGAVLLAAEKENAAKDASLEGLAQEGEESGEETGPRQVKEPPAKEVATFPAYEPAKGEPTDAPAPLEFPESLDSFFAKLTLTDLGMASQLTRVAHWGDSVLGNDGITAAVRFAMQARFGDGGHGFHAITQYDPSYRQKGVKFRELSAWDSCYVIQQRRCGADKHYGFGGSFGTSFGGAQSRFSPAEDGRFGRSFTKFEVWYAAQPRGGKFEIRVDKEEPVVVSTRADELEDRYASVEVHSGEAAQVSVVATGGGQARIYGVTLENDGPGLVWDGMGLIGSFTSRLSRQDPVHFEGQLTHRQSDLVVLMFGGNDMTREGSDLARTMKPYEEDLRELVQLVKRRAGNPPSCLIMAPIDHGERQNGRIVGRAIVPRMVEAQRKVAKEEGCAFLDTLAAMGGSGSVARWFRHEPRWASGDLSHPTAEGHKIIGKGFLYRAIMVAYANYRNRMQGKPLPLELLDVAKTPTDASATGSDTGTGTAKGLKP